MTRRPRLSFDAVIAGVSLTLALAMGWRFFVAPVFGSSRGVVRTTPIPLTPVPLQGASLGSTTAPVVVLEFSDFQCPYCGKFARETLGPLKAKYVDAGLLRLVLNHFPLDAIHPLAGPAAVSTECGRRQGAFWPLHDALFADQRGLKDVLARLGRTPLLDESLFGSCVTSPEAAAAVDANRALGNKLKVVATPTFFIGRATGADAVTVQRVLVGAVDLETLRQAIDLLLQTH